MIHKNGSPMSLTGFRIITFKNWMNSCRTIGKRTDPDFQFEK